MSFNKDDVAILALQGVAWGVQNVQGYHEEFMESFTEEELEILGKFEEGLDMTYSDIQKIAVDILKEKLNEIKGVE